MTKAEMEQKIEDLQKDIAAIEHEKMKLECSLYAEQNKWKGRCKDCLHTMVYDKYKSMTDYDRLIDFLEKAGIEYDTDTYTYESESGDEGILKQLVKFGKLDFEHLYEYEDKFEEIHKTHNLICEFDGNDKFVKMYNKEEE